jgi:O-succinylbenzoate synthase
MKIKSAEIIHIVLPMKFSFVTGFGEVKERDAVLVKLTSTDGLVGWGESAALAAPVYLEETVQTCIHMLKDFILPRLKDRELSIEEFVSEIAFIRGNNLAKHGAETAMWGVESLLKNMSVSGLIGGSRKSVPVGESVGMTETIGQLMGVVDKRLSEGYQRIKLKIKPGHDYDYVKSVRDAYPKIEIMVDGNSSYKLSQISDLKRLDELSLMMIEQPLGYDDIIDHAKLQKELKTPICLDESIITAEDARKAIEIGACKIINVKPGRVGGLIETMKINEIAKKAGVKLWCGGMLETGVGKAYNLAAGSLSEFSLPADIVPTSTFFREDITSPDLIVKKDGTIDVPSLSGLGYEVIEANINKYKIQSVEVF